MTQDNMFEKIEKNSKINKDSILKVADSVKDANFKDEKTVRTLVRQLAMLAGKPITKEKEDRIVAMIVNNNIPVESIGQMLKGN
ncbi:MAG: stage VI sporulation protein F [Bacilli bacterium]